MTRTLPALLALFATGAALAAPPKPTAPIYRCGPDGKQYSQTPCADGRMIEASDPRTAAQRAEAKRNAQRERQLGQEMAADRRRDEAATKPGAASGLTAVPLPASASAPAPGARHKARSRAHHPTRGASR